MHQTADAARPRFKDKFKHVAADAELAQAQAVWQAQSQDAASLATDLLINGYPAAFCGTRHGQRARDRHFAFCAWLPARRVR